MKLTYIKIILFVTPILLLTLYIYVAIRIKKAIDHQQSLNELYISKVFDQYKEHLDSKDENINE